MKRLERDEHREKRIDLEILADAYDEQERAMGWYFYLNNTCMFPFAAKCVLPYHKSPLKEGDEVQVSGLAPESKCLREIYVDAEWDGKDITVPLVQLQGIEADGQTQQAVDDWHYWVGRGYGF